MHLLITGKDALEKVTLQEASSKEITFTFQSASASLKKQVETFLEAYKLGKSAPLPTLSFPTQFTPFTLQVLEALASVPFGKTLAYSELSTLAGYPLAARAVGQVCNKNPFPFFIPCHRVVSKNGIGGFAYPLAFKEELLMFERDVLNTSI